jgi:protocatechuate 3,4-dioxygenase alpha subunit
MAATPDALTTSQTVGPFFHDCLLRSDARRHRLITADTPGEPIRITGRVIDGANQGVPDAMIEIWQADASGRYHASAPEQTPAAGAGFLGFGRCGTDTDGAFWFESIRPGAVRFDQTRWQRPHISVAVFGRGLLNHLFTRLYFADDPDIASDPVLSMVPPGRRSTLLAERTGTAGVAEYRLDIVLQGARETAFFDFGAASR